MGFVTNTAARHQGAVNMYWLHFEPLCHPSLYIVKDISVTAVKSRSQCCLGSLAVCISCGCNALWLVEAAVTGLPLLSPGFSLLGQNETLERGAFLFKN